ncbi:TauD/TfdA family dioxygenase [Streptomyces sp. FXJ1.4098]|nr:TauD/TfdA family dioxygenase [Streptomyces sp. FXJ1.4098]
MPGLGRLFAQAAQGAAVQAERSRKLCADGRKGRNPLRPRAHHQRARLVPEIASSANGVHAVSRDAEVALQRLQSTCREVAHEVFLRPGQALLINNRKGLHARSEFEPCYDGRDRWLQRTYIRRNHWSIRDRIVAETRRLHV